MSHFLIALAVATMAHAPSPPALEKAVIDYDLAQQHSDEPALRRLLADDYLLVGSTGIVETKEAFIKDLTSPDYHMNPFHVLRPISRTWSGGAVKGGVALLSGSSGGHAFSACLRFVDVWTTKDGRWQVAYSQAAKATPADCERDASERPAP